MAIIDFFDRGWRINPKATAYIQDDRHFSFDEVGELSCRIAQRTARRRLRHGSERRRLGGQRRDRVVLHAGAVARGMCWIPVGARNPAAENHFILDAFDCEVLFFQNEFAPVVAGLHPRTAQRQSVDLHRR